MEESNKGILSRMFANHPTFLKVLFVLSAVYVVFNLFGAIYNSISSDVAIENIQNTISQIEYSELSQMSLAEPYEEYLNNYLDNYSINNLLSMIVLLVDALGLILMFKGMRKGYWIYTLSNIILIIGTVSLSIWPNVFSAVFLVLPVVIFGVFQILYAINLKHLKR